MTAIKTIYLAIFAAAISLAPVLATSAPAMHTSASAEKKVTSKKTTTRKTAKEKAASKSSSVKFVPGSQETVGERNARLKRECKGAVNAGACTGYTN